MGTIIEYVSCIADKLCDLEVKHLQHELHRNPEGGMGFVVGAGGVVVNGVMGNGVVGGGAVGSMPFLGKKCMFKISVHKLSTVFIDIYKVTC